MSRAIDLTGRRFGRLIVLSQGPKRYRQLTWNCRCDCGADRTVLGGHLRRGNTLSCGCLSRERTAEALTTHGGCIGGPSKTYLIWRSMLTRTSNPKDSHSKYYLGRGIIVCDRWKSFENFIEDMGECPVGFSIERINNDGDYRPENCKWIHRANQASNKTSSVRVKTEYGEIVAAHAADKYGIPYKTLLYRLHAGWDHHKALTRPVQ